MPSTLHAGMAAGRWFGLSLMEQLGNIGSEVGRAAEAWRQGNAERKVKALERAFELLDLTLSDSRWRGGRLREICRSREVCVDTFYGHQEYQTTPEDLEKYFYHFAAAARNKIYRDSVCL